MRGALEHRLVQERPLQQETSRSSFHSASFDAGLRRQSCRSQMQILFLAASLASSYLYWDRRRNLEARSRSPRKETCPSNRCWMMVSLRGKGDAATVRHEMWIANETKKQQRNSAQRTLHSSTMNPSLRPSHLEVRACVICSWYGR